MENGFRPTALAVLIFITATIVVVAQQMDPPEARPEKGEGKTTLDKRLNLMRSGMDAESCSARGTATLGTPINGFLGSGSCTSYDATYGTLYVDFWLLSASAGHLLRVSSSSSMRYLATIQSSSTAAVVADSGLCGYTQNSCSFTYLVPASGTYYLGMGAYQTGSYTMTVSDITAGGGGTGLPNLTSYRPNYTGFSWSDKIVVTKSVPSDYHFVVDDAITTNDNVFASWAAMNEGSVTIPAAVGVTMHNSLYLDGVRIQGWSGAPGGGDWQGGFWVSDEGTPLGRLTAGSHTLEFRLDETNVVSESNENDNRYSKIFTVGNSSSVTCTSSSSTLCLNSGRFSVAVAYSTSTGSGTGTAVQLTSDTGYFWFFSASNVEVVVKIVDGRPFNNHFWVFAGGLTNVDTTITVTDTLNRVTRTYRNLPNTAFQPIQDTAAF